jgi:hypothetical protein
MRTKTATLTTLIMAGVSLAAAGIPSQPSPRRRRRRHPQSPRRLPPPAEPTVLGTHARVLPSRAWSPR